ncbi:unnamed protein product [Boreogadus saida]
MAFSAQLYFLLAHQQAIRLTDEPAPGSQPWADEGGPGLHCSRDEVNWPRWTMCREASLLGVGAQAHTRVNRTA